MTSFASKFQPTYPAYGGDPPPGYRWGSCRGARTLMPDYGSELEAEMHEHLSALVNSTPASDSPSAEPLDDDPQCTNCGIYRSEHGMAQCDGFTTKPGGFVVYTSDDLEEMSWEEKDDLFDWNDRDDYDMDDE